MECIAPLGGVYQAGTLSGNPLAMRAGIAMFKHLREPEFYDKLAAQLSKITCWGYKLRQMKQVFHLKLSKWVVCSVCISPIKRTLPALIRC